MACGGRAEPQVGADAGADGGGAEVQCGQLRDDVFEGQEVAFQEACECVEFLTVGHRHRILQLGASDGDVVRVLVGEVMERPREFLRLFASGPMASISASLQAAG